MRSIMVAERACRSAATLTQLRPNIDLLVTTTDRFALRLHAEVDRAASRVNQNAVTGVAIGDAILVAQDMR